MTDMAHAKDQVSIADGQITLYRRDDVRDALWQCRVNKIFASVRNGSIRIPAHYYNTEDEIDQIISVMKPLF